MDGQTVIYFLLPALKLDLVKSNRVGGGSKRRNEQGTEGKWKEDGSGQTVWLLFPFAACTHGRAPACAFTLRSQSPLGRVSTRVVIHFRDIKGIPACPERFLRDGTANDLLHRPFPVTLPPFSSYRWLYFSMVRRKCAWRGSYCLSLYSK